MLAVYVFAKSSFNHIDGITIRFRGWMIGIYWKSKIKALQNAGERRRSFGGGGDVCWHPGRDSGWPFSSGLPYISWKTFLLINCFAQCAYLEACAISIDVCYEVRGVWTKSQIVIFPTLINHRYIMTLYRISYVIVTVLCTWIKSLCVLT